MTISKRVSLVVIILLFIIILTFSIVKIYNYRNSAMNNFKLQMEQNIKFTENINTTSIWNYDTSSTKINVDALMKGRIFKAIYYYNKREIIISANKIDKKVIFKTNYDLKKFDIKVNSNIIVKEGDIIYQKNIIASYKIYFSKEYINKEIRTKIFTLFLEFIILSVIIFFSINISLKRIILTPFEKISKMALKFGKKTKELEEKLHGTKINSELLKKYVINTASLENSIESGNNDEIGRFFKNFLTIISAINSELKIIIDYSSTLEDKVKERTEELENAQKQMIDQAHKSGMAELASTTLHNIGNATNNVSIKLEKIPKNICEKYKLLSQSYLKIFNLVKDNADNFQEFINNDPLGKKLFTIFSKTNTMFADTLQHEIDDITHLRLLTNHVIEIIHVQNSYTQGVQTIKEVLRLSKVVDDAFEILMDSCKKRRVKVVKKYNSNAQVFLEKNKLLQVIVNLVKNSIESIDEKEKEIEIFHDKKIEIMIKKKFNWIVLIISDNGIGFDENLKHKIFEYKFSTKERGSGFGLHYAGNFMNTVNGKIKARNKGKKKGADFFLFFPVANN